MFRYVGLNSLWVIYKCVFNKQDGGKLLHWNFLLIVSIFMRIKVCDNHVEGQSNSSTTKDRSKNVVYLK